ncbi:hypothetical protein RclHR1_03090009 [Rhizophagus clarus]|uniref:Uncharacterized protein n=1 Tax=Rhizophagus clarus TaxID=94130 RepID=A0A2Z6RMH9_9GLOM|nr:hypothetical protein RclHR1_03090009 [Rhizophagus clarus]GES94575.1 hypothetical protein GLOIN_2v1524832 [Rhizophagus clarus]
MFVKKVSPNFSFNQIITRNTKLITNKKTNINNLLFGNNIRQSSSSSQEEASRFSRGEIDKITDIDQPPPGLDASVVRNTASGKEMPQSKAKNENDPDDAPTTVDSQAPAASESSKPSQIFDPKENKFIDANSARKEHQANTNENKSDKKIGEKFDDVIAELPSEQGSG